MTAEIIDFATANRFEHKRAKLPLSEIAEDEEAPREPAGALTVTAKNTRLRAARLNAWRRADALTCYWDALLDFTHAVSHAQRYGLKEARAYPETNEEARMSIVQSYRDALGKQLLTPAPDVASVNWKRRKLNEYGVNKELVEKAIAEDIAFLDAHPTRKAVRS